MTASAKPTDLNHLDGAFSDSSVPAHLRELGPESYASAAHYWRAALATEHLSPRLKELILLALYASATSLNGDGIRRHAARARVAGASQADVLDVLLSIVGLGNHALYFAIPILMKELAAAGREAELELPPLRADVEAIKADFIKTRGWWAERRETVARLLPDYFVGLSDMSMAPWKQAALTPKERELVYIAIDCSVTHQFEEGVAMHIRHALKHGATRDEILAVFQLAALMGMEGYILGAEALVGLPSQPPA